MDITSGVEESVSFEFVFPRAALVAVARHSSNESGAAEEFEVDKGFLAHETRESIASALSGSSVQTMNARSLISHNHRILRCQSMIATIVNSTTNENADQSQMQTQLRSLTLMLMLRLFVARACVALTQHRVSACMRRRGQRDHGRRRWPARASAPPAQHT